MKYWFHVERVSMKPCPGWANAWLLAGVDYGVEPRYSMAYLEEGKSMTFRFAGSLATSYRVTILGIDNAG